jgi:L-ascorbate metabolism protein UlaG (beta-lactamase superfamily)
MNIVTAALVGGPTIVLRYAGLTIVTDPTFDPPGKLDGLTKTEGPAIEAADLPPIDLALVSHDHHADNLDLLGYDVARGATLALTTVAGAGRKEGLTGMAAGDVVTIDGPTPVTVTAVEALHGPKVVAPLTGPVIGFILRAEGWPTLYFSGDNSLVSVVKGIADAHPDVTIAVLCMGAAAVPTRGPVILTLNADRAAKVAALWPNAVIVPVHVDGWKHFSQQRAAALAGLAGHGLGDRVVALKRGVETAVNA